jgi:hypothetical protein
MKWEHWLSATITIVTLYGRMSASPHGNQLMRRAAWKLMSWQFQLGSSVMMIEGSSNYRSPVSALSPPNTIPN